MKFEFSENNWSTSVTLRPETPEEVAQLARMALNAAAEPPEVALSVTSNSPYGVISVSKVKPTAQRTYITRKMRK